MTVFTQITCGSEPARDRAISLNTRLTERLICNRQSLSETSRFRVPFVGPLFARGTLKRGLTE
ncbi:hypothetical protein EMIT0P294_170033 [Pseudomonas sp. IT-P294]